MTLQLNHILTCVGGGRLEIERNHLIQRIAAPIPHSRQRGDPRQQSASGKLLAQLREIASRDANDTHTTTPNRGCDCGDGVWLWLRPAVHSR
jgi:hypothetical protein